MRTYHDPGVTAVDVPIAHGNPIAHTRQFCQWTDISRQQLEHRTWSKEQRQWHG
jgi:hypothetical protein